MLTELILNFMVKYFIKNIQNLQKKIFESLNCDALIYLKIIFILDKNTWKLIIIQ